MDRHLPSSSNQQGRRESQEAAYPMQDLKDDKLKRRSRSQHSSQQSLPQLPYSPIAPLYQDPYQQQHQLQAPNPYYQPGYYPPISTQTQSPNAPGWLAPGFPGPQQPQYQHPSAPQMPPDMFYYQLQQQQQSPPETAVQIRKRIVRRIQLFRGNLVINCPVPDHLLQTLDHQQVEEVGVMRYTAVTSEPDQFVYENFTLRQQLYHRRTELFIVVTMYNEDDLLFTRTMTALQKNIAYLCSRNRSDTWGPDGWKKVVVCIVADGRAKIHPRVLEVLGVMGCYQEGVAKSDVNGKPVQAHLYEYTTQVCVEPDLKVCGTKDGYVPVQMLFCLKEDNKKKINSHRWFFNAFAPILQPTVCMLLDVGTKPTSHSIYHLWKAFDMDPDLGGACGEIAADLGKACLHVGNPLVAGQNFEYKISNILDKPLESVFGYISVLPGAFSAYRYKALLNHKPGEGPLASYFEGELLISSPSIFKANMYLAEDRILCFELVAKENSKWVLKYVKAARAYTDVPERVPEFISQRRRWLNGSFFASVYALAHWYRIWRTKHSIFQKLMFQLQLLYNTVQMIFTWFGLAFFYLTFFFLTQNVIGQNDPFVSNGIRFGEWIFQIFRQIYLFAIVIIFITSLGNRPQGSKWIYILCFVLFAIIMALMLFLVGWTVAYSVNTSLSQAQGANIGSKFVNAFMNSSSFRNIFLSLLSLFGIYLIGSILHGDPWHMFTSFIQYLLLLPSFVNILMVYAFCNTHDVSWGTKGDNKASSLGSATTSKTKKSNKTDDSSPDKLQQELDMKDQVDVELPFESPNDKETMNNIYERWLNDLPNRPKEERKKRDQITKLEDWYKNFRTQLVLWWMLSNALLIVIMTNDSVVKAMGGDDPNSNPFLSFIFWSCVGLSFFRFVGSFIYLLGFWRGHYGSCRCC